MKRRNFINVFIGAAALAQLPPLLASPSREASFEAMLERYVRYDPQLGVHQVSYEIFNTRREGAVDLTPTKVIITHAPDGVWCSIAGMCVPRKQAMNDWRFRVAALMAIVAVTAKRSRTRATGSSQLTAKMDMELVSAARQLAMSNLEDSSLGNITVTQTEQRAATPECPFPLHNHFTTSFSGGLFHGRFSARV